MKKEDLYPLIGKYLNGYKIIKIEEDPFIKGQINLWTDEWRTEYFGDKSIVKFFVRPESNSSKVYQELIDKQIYTLKDNWNKLKEYIEEDFNFFGKLTAPKYGCAMGALRRVADKMHELEQGSDSDE